MRHIPKHEGLAYNARVGMCDCCRQIVKQVLIRGADIEVNGGPGYNLARQLALICAAARRAEKRRL